MDEPPEKDHGVFAFFAQYRKQRMRQPHIVLFAAHHGKIEACSVCSPCPAQDRAILPDQLFFFRVQCKQVVQRFGAAYKQRFGGYGLRFGIPVLTKCILTPYGLIARSTDREGEFELKRDSIFYEFCPRNIEDPKKMLRADEVELQTRYDLYITNHSGLYRFKTNLSVEILSTAADRIIVKF